MTEVVRKKLKVPRLTEMSMRDATIVLRASGFPQPDIQYVESYAPLLTVVEQSPNRGQIVDSDRVIQLKVSQQNLIRFMPGIYQRDSEDGSNVMKGLLWVIQHLLDDINESIDHIHQYFAPYETPEEFVPWLAQWVAFTLDENWSLEQKRTLVKKAVDFYRLRGTVKGLKLYLKLFTGHEPDIIENQWPFRGFQIGLNSTIGVDSVILPPVNLAHCFIVDFPIPPEDVTDEMIIKIHDIIRAQKPAHTTYFLRFRGERRSLSSFGIVIGEHAVGIGDEVVGNGESEEEHAFDVTLDDI